MKLNSKNSSKPPSTDYKANTTSKSRKERKSRKGVARTTFPPEKVDKSIECTLKNCPHCGSLSIENIGTPEALHQIELPNIRALITEYLLNKYSCSSCDKRSIAKLPIGVPDSAFGPRLMGLFATLTGVLHIAKREAIQLMKDLYDVDISLGSAINIEERAMKALNPVYYRIHNLIIENGYSKHFRKTSTFHFRKPRYLV